MKLLESFLCAVALCVCCCSNGLEQQQGQSPLPAPAPMPQSTELKIVTSLVPTVIDAGGYYGRVHKLADGRLMAVYAAGSNGMFRFSSDKGDTWGASSIAVRQFSSSNGVGITTVRIDNAESAQLSAGNPFHPGRIIYACNLRPVDSRIYPFSIGVAVSDDSARSFSQLDVIYSSDTWSRNTGKGCWEPYVLELPDGTVQVYFADETPYYREGKGSQNISVVESHDGGDTWSEARPVCYTEGRRDGMPVVMLMDGWMYLAIEHAASGEAFHPQIVACKVEDNWSTCVEGTSASRFEPLASPAPYSKYYRGAPYITRTDDYILLSWQSSEGSSVKDTDHAMMEIAAVPVSEVKNHKFTTMRAEIRPDFGVRQSSSNVLWNSICPLEDNQFLAVATVAGKGLLCLRCKVSGTE